MPTNPYVINGTVIDTDSTIVTSTNVIAHNTTTGERVNPFATTSSGRYVLDLANLSSGYSQGDSITVYVRQNGYTGEVTFTLSGEGGRETNITTTNQVTFATLRNKLWTAFKSTLNSGTFAISNTLTNSQDNDVNATTRIYSAMNDTLISDVGYPLIIIFPPLPERVGVTLDNAETDGEINFLIEVYHTSSENAKILIDEVENQIWRAQEVWTGLGLDNLNMPAGDNDWWTEGNRKIHRIGINANFTYNGVVTIP